MSYSYDSDNNNYWYQALYYSQHNNQHKEVSGGLKASSAAKALEATYAVLDETTNSVLRINIYELKDHGELGDLVMQSGYAPTAGNTKRLPAPDKNTQTSIPFYDEREYEEYKEVFLYELGHIRTAEVFKELTFGDGKHEQK